MLPRRSVVLATMSSPPAVANPHQTARLPLLFSSNLVIRDSLVHILISHVVGDTLRGGIDAASTSEWPYRHPLMLSAAINLITTCCNSPM
jgi:hypothetical protein